MGILTMVFDMKTKMIVILREVGATKDLPVETTVENVQEKLKILRKASG